MSDTTNDNSSSAPSAPGSIAPHIIAVAILLVGAYGAFKWYQVREFESSRGDAIPVAAVGPPLTEFELTRSDGQPFRTSGMKGRVWVATYFFTTCPGNCLRLNQNIKFLHNLPDLKEVTWVSITCDPDNDTIEALADYAKRWEADPERWLFTRADLDYTKRVAAGMNIGLYRKNHQDYAIVIDKTGKIRGMYDATSKSQSERLYQKLLELEAEQQPRDLAATKAEKTST
jgi:cytochrome oxidase Cu insertion factor (SCO1/SenC/PrrC family)